MRPVQGKTKIKRSRLDGYGVFAARDIRAGEVIEQMPALAIRHDRIKPKALTDQACPLSTHSYHPTGLHEVWIGTGTSSFFNAAKDFNADILFDWDSDLGVDWIIIVANRGIRQGQEITLDYLEQS